MTNEQEKAKELAKLLNAFAEEKPLQMKSIGEWYDYSINVMETFIKDFYNPMYQFRIKPETKRIALTQQDLIERVKNNFSMYIELPNDYSRPLVLDWDNEGIITMGGHISYSWLAQNSIEFLDNSPCYKEVECE